MATVLTMTPVAIGFVFGREILGLALLPVGLAAAIAHEVVCTAVWGRTLGKRLQGIKVVRVEDGTVPGLSRALRRFGWEMIVIPLGVLFREDRRGYHDRRAGTAVVRARRR